MLPYIGPFLTFLLLIQIPAAFPGTYSWSYPLVVVLTGTVAWRLLRGRHLIQPNARVLPGMLVGVVGVVLWIWLSGLGLEEKLLSLLPAWLQPPGRVAFNPLVSFPDPFSRLLFVAVRLLGLVILVPLIEEIFWRGFLLRFAISRDWGSRPIGEFTPGSFLVVTILFALAHPEWLAAAAYCALLNGFLYWRKNLWECIVAHATSNLILGIYVLITGTWELW